MIDANPVYIYALRDPRTNKIRYVGKTTDMHRRHLQHLNPWFHQHYKSHKNSWVESLRNEGLEPLSSLLDTVVGQPWEPVECMWIQWLKDCGCDLVNLSAGGTQGPGLLGENHPRAKLTDEIVTRLRQEARAGRTNVEMAKELGVVKDTVRMAVAGETWKHVAEPPFAAGAGMYHAVFTDETVVMLRRRARMGDSTTVLSKEYGFSVTAIHKAVTGETWKHVAEPPCVPKVKQKVSAADVLTMKQMRREGASQREIASRFGVSRPHVSVLLRSPDSVSAT